MAMKVGNAAIRIMDVLDRAHTDRFGIPQPITVSQNQIEGHCIVVTGHNLYALEELLRQTEGKGINIYTHSEMLPAHGYPALKKYAHLKGNIGKAWYDQRRLFEEFPGAILATTNCVMPIKGTYADRFFSYEVAGLEGVTKIEGENFAPLIERALSLPVANVQSEQVLTTGYHHETVIDLHQRLSRPSKTGTSAVSLSLQAVTHRVRVATTTVSLLPRCRMIRSFSQRPVVSSVSMMWITVLWEIRAFRGISTLDNVTTRVQQ